MASELNSVQESIKLALDAADAATDVTYVAVSNVVAISSCGSSHSQYTNSS